jgi:hypothetical protein
MLRRLQQVCGLQLLVYTALRRGALQAIACRQASRCILVHQVRGLKLLVYTAFSRGALELVAALPVVTPLYDYPLSRVSYFLAHSRLLHINCVWGGGLTVEPNSALIEP